MLLAQINNKLAFEHDMQTFFFNEIRTIWMNWTTKDLDFKVLFLYKETRRSHPLAANGHILGRVHPRARTLLTIKNISQKCGGYD